MSTLPLPVTVEVSARGAVSLMSPSRVIGMSPYSERARRLALTFGPGAHVISTTTDVDDLPTGVADDLTDALDV